MAPRRYSRYSYAEAYVDPEGDLVLSEPLPFGFVALVDNVQHVVEVGDDLFVLAGRYFAPLERAAGLWWVIADFQPVPILDPTVPPDPGTVLHIPSLRTVLESVFNERRRAQDETG